MPKFCWTNCTHTAMMPVIAWGREVPQTGIAVAGSIERTNAATAQITVFHPGAGDGVMKFGLHFQLPCSAGQSQVQRYRDTLDQAAHAETLGFDSVWPVEQHFNANLSIMP